MSEEPLFDAVLNLEEDDVIKFSGKFMDGGSDVCVNDSRLTLKGKVSDPSFIFRFDSVKKVG